jgi:hypothetical protein
VLGPAACSSEDQPDNGQDAASDAPRSDTRSDISVGTDVSNDTSVDQREAGTPDTGTPDGGAPDTGTPDGGTPDTGTPEGGNCVGGGDAERDGAIGMAVVTALRCANCHQDEPPDAGLILSGRLATIVADAGVFPKNLTPEPMTGLGCWTDDEIINAIMNGINNQGQMLCSRMPKFGTQIDAGGAQEIVNFLRTLPAVQKAIPQTVVCPPRPPPPEGGTDAGDGGAPPSDGGTDGTTSDAGPDQAAPDGGQDSAAPDGGTDAAPPDTGTGDGTSIDVEIDVETDGG